MTRTMHPAVTLSVERNLARITIDNPLRANALTRSMLHALRRHLETVAASPRIRAVIITGAGSNFCAGLDITGIQSGAPDSIEHEYVEAESSLAICPKPTIAVIRGHCIGGGAQLAVACDLRIASDDARFAITPAKLGLIYPPESVERLTRVIGPAAAKRLLFTADPITASEAKHYGLINDITGAADLDEAADRVAAVIAIRSPVSITAAKQMIDDTTAYGAIRETVRDHWRSADNEDLPTGLAAFAAKTAPDFPDYTDQPRPEEPSPCC